jgi:hypothetical protein
MAMRDNFGVSGRLHGGNASSPVDKTPRVPGMRCAPQTVGHIRPANNCLSGSDPWDMCYPFNRCGVHGFPACGHTPYAGRDVGGHEANRAPQSKYFLYAAGPNLCPNL